MSDEAARLGAWIERGVGGRVIRVTPLARWRPAWDVDVELDGHVLALHARGEREPRIVMPNRIADEVAVHDLLEAHGIPVPHAYGLCDDPYALVMDRLSGHVDLSFAADDAERSRVLDEYLGILARIYAIPLAAAAGAGFALPGDSAATGLGGYWRRLEAQYDRLMEGRPADPVAEFLRRWMRDNVPPGRHAAARFIPYDAFQFMFDGGRVTGLIDFEHAHVGDPMMDLAALRVRDTIKNIGELSDTAARYEKLTGVAIDHDVVEYHTVLYNAISVLSTGPPLADPLRGTDWLSYLAWYVNGARWAFECIAEIRGYRLAPVAVPEARPSRHAPALRHLVNGLRALSAETDGDYELAGLGRVANHLKRVDEVGAALDAADLEDLSRVLGYRPDPTEAEAELLTLVATAGPEREEELVRLLDARMQRMHLAMASPTSLMLRHPLLRSLRADRPTVRDPNDGWPAGAIPGTA
ncbi:MAG TPA: phosphotransferase [Acidimicrobiia bacterium]|nr:phosphotransferase [Acidimicrobiia bacterium]